MRDGVVVIEESLAAPVCALAAEYGQAGDMWETAEELIVEFGDDRDDLAGWRGSNKVIELEDVSKLLAGQTCCC